MSNFAMIQKDLIKPHTQKYFRSIYNSFDRRYHKIVVQKIMLTSIANLLACKIYALKYSITFTSWFNMILLLMCFIYTCKNIDTYAIQINKNHIKNKQKWEVFTLNIFKVSTENISYFKYKIHSSLFLCNKFMHFNKHTNTI